MIKLRELQEKDAPLMLEWMHDPDIQKGFKKNMLDTTIKDAVDFCKSSVIPIRLSGGENLHFAIVDDKDEYLGTISLKCVDLNNKTAEYAITTRKSAQGHGVAAEATRLILNKAFCEYGLHRVYLSVLSNNESAIQLYERCGFVYEGEFRQHLKIGEKYIDWKWYGMLKDEYNEATFGKDEQLHDCCK